MLVKANSHSQDNGDSSPRIQLEEVIDLLLVDDRPENLLTLEAVLSAPGYRLIKATSGQEALRYLLDHDPAVILMDVQMPGMDGFEAASLIKRSERTREIPIIFLTAINKDDGFTHKGYAYGAVDYIYKPFDPVALRSKVAVFADLARKTRRLLQAEKALREREVLERERQLIQLELRGLRRERINQEKYRDLVEGIHHGVVWSADPESLAISFVSPSAERILGYPLEQWVEEREFFSNHLHPADRERVIKAIHSARIEHRDQEIEHRFITPDQKEVWLHTGVRIAQKGEGSGQEFRALSVDITQLKKAEDKLQQNKLHSDFLAKASLLLSESLDYQATLTRLGELAVPRMADWYAVEVLDESGAIQCLAVHHSDPSKVRHAQEYMRRFPSDPDAPTGTPHVLKTGCSELYPEITETMLRAGIDHPEKLQMIMELGLRSVIIVPLIVRGKVFGTLTFVSAESEYRYDTTDLRLAEDLARRAASAIDNAFLYEESQKAIRARDEFLSIASHELKTPITPLKIQTQGLMRLLRNGRLAEVQPDRLNRMLQTSEKQLNRLTRLVDDLLDISRISNGRLSLHVEEFDFVELVKDTVERFSGQLTERGTLTFHPPASICVRWDRFRIEQVLINLISNAIKYGQERPIHVTVQQEDGQVAFSIEDHGIGIPNEDLERIFHRFERAISGDHFGGLGLGLYIASQIIEAHHGAVHVASEVGAGSTFTVRIPLQLENTSRT